MTREEIIRMARDAGSIDSEDVIETVYAAFAAAEREACLQAVRVAMLGAEWVLTERVLTAIRARGQA